jgi:timeless
MAAVASASNPVQASTPDAVVVDPAEKAQAPDPYYSDDNSDDDEISRKKKFLKNQGLIKDHKYMTDLLAICTGIGATEKETLPNGNVKKIITKGDDCEECVHDLQRYLRKDDDERSMHRMLGSWRILQNKLLPLVTTYHTSDPKLIFSVTKVLVMLTMPPEENGPAVAQEMRYLVRYKEAFLSNDILAIFVAMLEEPLSHNGFDRTDDDNMLIELVLTLFRNLLHVPNPAYSSVSGGEHLTHLQEDFIVLLKEEFVLDTVLLLAQLVEDEANRDWNLLLLELFYLLFRGQSPEMVANEDGRHASYKHRVGSEIGKQTSTVGGKRIQEAQHFDPLANMIVQEHRQRLVKKRGIGARHSKFGGSYVLKDEEDQSGQKLVLHSAWRKMEDRMKSSLPPSKSVLAKQRRADAAAAQTALLTGLRPDAFTVGYGYGTAMSAPMATKQLGVRVVLKEFASQFITKAYPALMRSLVRDFRRESARLLPSDMIQYIYVSAFCTSFHRRCEDMRLAAARASKASCEPFDWGPVSATMDLWSFHFTVKSIDRYLDLKDWVATGVSVALLKEMVVVLDRLRKSSSSARRETANQLINVVFYEREIIDLVPRLLGRCHSARKHVSSWFVTDLVETAHVILDITEHLAEHKMFVLQRRKKVKEKLKMRPWKSEEIHALEEAVKKYGKTKKKFQQILKSPEFGPIFLEGRIVNELQLKYKTIAKLRKDGKEGNFESDEEDNEEETEEQKKEKREEASIRRECEFKFNTFMNKFAQNSVYQVYMRLLRTYKTNTPQVNHCIVKVLYRLTQLEVHEYYNGDSESPEDKINRVTHEPVMFQVSTLMLFELILNDRDIKRDRNFRELREFTASVVRHFFRLAKKNPLMYVEALFNRPRRMNELLVHVYDADSIYSSSKGGSRSKKAAAEKQQKDPGNSGALNDSDLDQEEEAELEDQDFGKKAKARAEAKARERDERSGRRRNNRRWGEHEDAVLLARFPALRHLDAVYEILALDDVLQDKERSSNQIKNRVKQLGLLDGTHKTRKESLGIQTAQLKKQVDSVLQVRVMEGAAASETVGRDAIKSIQDRLKECADFRDEQKMLRETMRAMGDGETDDDLVIASTVDYALVPVTQDEFAHFANRHVVKLFKALNLREPGTGEVYWRIPGTFSADECRNRVKTLRATVLEIDTAESEMQMKEAEAKRFEGLEEYGAGEEEEAENETAQIKNGSVYHLESSQEMMMSANIQGKVSADRISTGQWETFRFLGSEDTFAIRTHHSNFVTVDSEGKVVSSRGISEAGEREKFLLAYQDGKILLQHKATGFYLSATEDGKVTCKTAMVGATSLWFAKEAEDSELSMPEVSASPLSSPQKGKRRVATLYEESDSDSDDDEELKGFFANAKKNTDKVAAIEAVPVDSSNTVQAEEEEEEETMVVETEENDEEEGEQPVKKPTQKLQKKRRMVLEDSDDDDDD